MSRLASFAVALLLCMTVSGYVHADVSYSPPRITVSQTPVVPSIDGRLSDGEWDNAVQITGFIGNQTGVYDPSPQPVVYVTYDAKQIYLAFDVPYAGKSPSKSAKRDASVWLDDSFEFYLDPGKSGKEYYQFAVSKTGDTYEGTGGGAGWNCNWEYRTAIANGRWTGEIAIPFAQIGAVTPANGDAWGFNIAHTYLEKAPINTTISRMRNNNSLALFGTLVFRKNAPLVRIESLGGILNADLNLKGKVWSSSAGEVEWKSALQVGDKKQDENKTAKTNDVLNTRLSLSDVSVGEQGVVTLSVTDKDGSALLSQVIPFEVAPPFKLSYISKGLDGKLEITTSIRYMPKSAERMALKICDNASGATVWQTVAKMKGSAPVRASLSTLAFPKGDYTISANLLDKEGRTIGSDSAKFCKPDESWRGTKVGITDKVPTPWTPMKADNSTIECWGRTYTPGGPVVSQIVSQGKGLLTSPVRFDCVMNGTATQWQWAKPKIVQSKPGKVTYKNTGKTDTAVFESTVAIEYDGMMRVDCKIRPTKPVKLDKLVLEIPISAESAKYISTTKYVYGELFQGYLPLDGYKCDFHPWVWLTDEHRGLCWFSETNDNWKLKPETKAIEVVRQGSEVLLRLNIVDVPQEMEKPYALTFGLHPTPVKPFPEKWRTQYRFADTYCVDRYYLYPAKQKDFEAAWERELKDSASNPTKITARNYANAALFQTHPESTTAFGFPEAKDPEKTRQIVDLYHTKGIKVLPYYSPEELHSYGAESIYYSDQWLLGGDLGVVDDSGRTGAYRGSSLYLISPESKGWIDLMAYKAKKFVEECGFDGLYEDWGEMCLAFYTYDGKSKWPIFAYREMHKRIYVAMKELNPENRIVVHCSSGIAPWCASFFDAVCSGEEPPRFHGKGTSGDNIDRFMLDKFLAEYTPEKLGLPAMALSFTWSSEPYDAYKYMGKEIAVPYTEALVALTAIHDVSIMNITGDMDNDVVDKWYKCQDAFGVDDVRFVGYWENESGIRVSHKDTKVSAYVKNDGSEAMLIVANLADTAVDETIDVDMGTLTGRSGKTQLANARELYNKDLVKFDNGSVSLRIPRHTLRVVELTGSN